MRSGEGTRTVSTVERPPASGNTNSSRMASGSNLQSPICAGDLVRPSFRRLGSNVPTLGSRPACRSSSSSLRSAETYAFRFIQALSSGLGEAEVLRTLSEPGNSAWGPSGHDVERDNARCERVILKR